VPGHEVYGCSRLRPWSFRSPGGRSIYYQKQKQQPCDESETKDPVITNRPKYKTNGQQIKLHKLSEEKKIVNVEIRIKHNNTWIIDNFDWNLNYEHISVKEFVRTWVERTAIDKENIKNIYDQMMNQLLAHIESQ
jgi:hypothetical protein